MTATGSSRVNSDLKNYATSSPRIRRTAEGGIMSARYFYLSYAHSPPLAGSPLRLDASAPDEWVREFFQDLSGAVSRLASADLGLAPGFIDLQVSSGQAWKETLVRALGEAEVFVPLYSPGYLSKSWPGREWACFAQRIEAAGISDPLRRFAPVLWVPLPAGAEPRGLPAALNLVPASAPDDATSAYQENGLLAMRRLRPYRKWYQLITDELAARIVRLAEGDYIGPSPAPDIETVDSAFAAGAAVPVLAVVVVAPAGSELAEYGQMAGEQLDFAVRAIGMEAAVGSELLARNPVLVVIDPSYVSNAKIRASFEAFTAELPPWSVPALGPGPAAEVSHSLGKMTGTKSRAARRALRGVGSLSEFATLLPFLVAEAGREYLRLGPVDRPTPRPGARPRLAGPGWTANSM
jgi:hypothetical protein